MLNICFFILKKKSKCVKYGTKSSKVELFSKFVTFCTKSTNFTFFFWKKRSYCTSTFFTIKIRNALWKILYKSQNMGFVPYWFRFQIRFRLVFIFLCKHCLILSSIIGNKNWTVQFLIEYLYMHPYYHKT